jgi:hypothetical protein
MLSASLQQQLFGPQRILMITRQYPTRNPSPVPVVLALLALLVTKSPAWLALKGRSDNTRRVLLRLRKNNAQAVDAGMNSLNISVSATEKMLKTKDISGIF